MIDVGIVIEILKMFIEIFGIIGILAVLFMIGYYCGSRVKNWWKNKLK
jgi:hypothetical protein